MVSALTRQPLSETDSCSVQNDIIKQAFMDSRCISAIASEEEDNVESINTALPASSHGSASSDTARWAPAWLRS